MTSRGVERSVTMSTRGREIVVAKNAVCLSQCERTLSKSATGSQHQVLAVEHPPRGIATGIAGGDPGQVLQIAGHTYKS